MKERFLMCVLVLAVLVLSGTGCSSNKEPSQSLTVTFKGNQCTRNGTAPIAAGQVSVTMVVRNNAQDSAMVVLTLDEGKTVEDLRALPPNQGEAPRWSHRVGAAERHVHPGERYTFEFTAETGPVYLICFSGTLPEAIIGVLGPIEVTK